jgi:hypothetical protein
MVDKGTLDRCLQGTSYPAHRNQLIDRASANRCPGEVLIALVDLPEGTYPSEDDVLCRLGNPAFCGRSEEVAQPSLQGAPEPAEEQVPLEAFDRRPGLAPSRTTIVLAVLAAGALAIVLWAVFAAVISQ